MDVSIFVFFNYLKLKIGLIGILFSLGIIKAIFIFPINNKIIRLFSTQIYIYIERRAYIHPARVHTLHLTTHLSRVYTSVIQPHKTAKVKSFVHAMY